MVDQPKSLAGKSWQRTHLWLLVEVKSSLSRRVRGLRKRVVKNKMPYKDQTLRKLKAKEYIAAYRAKQKTAKNLLPKIVRICLVCFVDISNKRQGAKFCSKAHKSAFYGAQRDYAAEYVANQKNRREQAIKYYRKDLIKSRAKQLTQQKNNLSKFAAYEAKRRAIKLQRTPPWLTEDHYWMMKETYAFAAFRTKIFGFRWHVDHIVPLQGQNVSGLHVPWNLQVIPAVENIAKHNKFEVV